jgi:L-iditol 2-dehydrogenase
MKAIVHTGTRAVEVQDRPVPTPGPGEVRVAVEAAGLCGSDAHAYIMDDGYEWIQLPRIMGHEYAGVVDSVGDEVEHFAPGDHVVEEPVHDCGTCFQCQNDQSNVCQHFEITGMHEDGAYADYTLVDQADLHRLPKSIPFEHAAITEPTSIATRAVFDRSSLMPGDNVLVEGPGPIGTLTALVADSLGANVVVSGLERDASHRLPALADRGIETVQIDAEDLADRTASMTDGVGFDVVFDATGHHTGVETAIEHTRKGGQIVVIGLPGDPSDVFLTPLVRGEIDCLTSYGSVWRNFEQALRIVENGSLDPSVLVDTSYDVDDPTTAFEDFLNGDTGKPVFRFRDS